MGRHASGEKNYRVAKGPFIALLIVIVLIGAVFSWINLRRSNDTAVSAARNECTKGDLTLVVTSDPAAVGEVQKLVAAYGESNPVIRDYCIRPQITVAGSQEVVAGLLANATPEPTPNEAADNSFNLMRPGVWIPADISFVNQALASTKVKVNAPKAWLPPIRSGVAVKADRAAELANTTWEQFAAQRIVTQGGSDAALSSLVSTRLGGGPEAAHGRAELGGVYTSNTLLAMLGRNVGPFEGVAATEAMVQVVSDGIALVTPPDSPELHAPIVTFGSGGAIDENTARAAEDFAEFASGHGANGQPADSAFGPEVADVFRVLSAIQTDSFALPPELSNAPAQAPTQPPVTPAGSALLIADTADGADVAALAQAITQAIDAAPSGRYGLWTIAPEVNQLVALGGAEGDSGTEAAKAILPGLPAGGGAQLWPALIQAYQAARDGFVPNRPNRIIVLTSGHDASGSDPALALQEIRDMIDPARPVSMEIIVLPGGDTNSAQLQEVASLTGGKVLIAADYQNGLMSQLTAAVGQG